MAYTIRECAIEELQPELQATVKRSMPVNDGLVACFETKNEPDAIEGVLGLIMLELPRTTYNAYVISQQYLIHAETGKPNSSSSSMRLLDIVSVKEDEFGIYARGHGNSVIWLPFRSEKEISKKFVEILRNTVEKARNISSVSPSQPPTNIEERLRVLTQLHKDNLINDIEFQEKRKEILGEL